MSFNWRRERERESPCHCNSTYPRHSAPSLPQHSAYRHAQSLHTDTDHCYHPTPRPHPPPHAHSGTDQCCLLLQRRFQFQVCPVGCDNDAHLMRDDKKEASKVKQTARQSNTEHPRQSLNLKQARSNKQQGKATQNTQGNHLIFIRKMNCLRRDSNPLHSRQSTLLLSM